MIAGCPQKNIHNVQETTPSYLTHEEPREQDAVSRQKWSTGANTLVMQMWELLDKDFKQAILTMFTEVKNK